MPGVSFSFSLTSIHLGYNVHVRRLRTLGTFRDLEFYLITFVKRLESIFLNG